MQGASYLQSKPAKVFRDPILVKLIVKYLDKPDLLNLWLVEKLFVPIVASHILREINWVTYQRLDPSNPLGAKFCDAVRRVQVTTAPPDRLSWWKSQGPPPSDVDPQLYNRMREKCPNLSHVCARFEGYNLDEYSSLYGHGSRGFGTIRHPVHVNLELDVKETLPIRFPKRWKDWDLSHMSYASFVTSPRTIVSAERQKQYLEWLIDPSNNELTMCGVRLIDLPCTLEHITAVASKTLNHHERRYLEVAAAHMVPPFTLDELELFGKSLNFEDEPYLREVALYHWDQDEHGPYMRPPLISITNLPSLVQIIRTAFTAVVQSLTLVIRGMDGEGFFRDEQIPLSTEPYADTHEGPSELNLIFEEEFGLHPEELPLFALARNMAVLKRYCVIRVGYVDRVTRGWIELEHETQLLLLIRTWFRCLPRERLIHMRWVNFRTIDMPIPSLQDLTNLTFTPEHRPIPRKTQRALNGLKQAGQSWERIKEREEYYRQLIEERKKGLEHLQSLLELRGEVFEEPINPFKNYRGGVLDEEDFKAVKLEIKDVKEESAKTNASAEHIETNIERLRSEIQHKSERYDMLKRERDSSAARIEEVKEILRETGRDMPE